MQYIRVPTEKEIVDDLLWLLRMAGKNPRPRASCGVGLADVLTDRAVYEVKRLLTTHDMAHALGQALMYRDGLVPERKAVIVGTLTTETIHSVIRARNFGVSVLAWCPDETRLFSRNIEAIEGIDPETLETLAYDRLKEKASLLGQPNYQFQDAVNLRRPVGGRSIINVVEHEVWEQPLQREKYGWDDDA